MGPEAGRKLDSWLDEALKHYGEAEPRSGLETRILARLRIELHERNRAWGWLMKWGYLASGSIVVAAVLLLALWLWPMGSPPAPAIERRAAVPPPIITTRAASPTRERMPAKRIREGSVLRSHNGPGLFAGLVEKQQQFPSPAPLSEQEVLLAAYVSQHHDRAVLVARAQTQMIKRDLKQWQVQAESVNPSGQHPEEN